MSVLKTTGSQAAHPAGGGYRPRTRNANVYELLRADIIECRLEPDARLRFDDLRRRYATGVSPIREALMRLSSDGLVALEEHRGFRVTSVSRDQLTDLTATRRELEAMAIRQAIDKGTVAWEAGIVARFHELANTPMQNGADALDPSWENRHKAFHESLYSACGSPWLIRFCGLLSDQVDRYRHLWFRHFRQTRDILGEHRALMNAVLERDAPTATSLIQTHLSRTADALLAGVPELAGPAERATSG